MAEIGQRVGEYVLETKVGQGAFGEVWRAHHHAWSDQIAAVKIPTDPEYVRNLRSEGVSLHRLIHPNIARAIGFDPVATPPYLMTEFVEGSSLRELMAGGPLSVDVAVAILKQVLKGLSYAHGRGVIHGDIKPENVLVSATAANGPLVPSAFNTEGAIKIADFGVGIAAMATSTNASSKTLVKGSERGMVMTLAYIAPEQRDGAMPDVKSDLFACGVLLFEMLTGDRPAGTELPSELAPGIPPWVDTVFRKSYARRDRRFESAQAFLEALELESAPSSGATSPAPVESRFTPPPFQPSVPVAAPMRAPEAPRPLAAAVETDDDADAPLLRFKPDDYVAPPSDEPSFASVPVAAPEPTPAPPMVPIAAAPPVAAPAPRPPEAPKATAPAAAPMAPNSAAIVIDEFQHKSVRTGDDIKAVFRSYSVFRSLEEAEINNVRVRLGKWAETKGGGADFGERIDITIAGETPFHRVTLQTRYVTAASVPEIQTAGVKNPESAIDCESNLQPADYRVFAHLSCGAFGDSMAESLPDPGLRAAVMRVLSNARAAANGRTIARQDLHVARANVLSVRYRYDGNEHSACLVGNALTIVAPSTPVTRIREDLTKRAVQLLDSDQIGAGLRDLRKVLDNLSRSAPQRAASILASLRAKLATAYLAEARAVRNSFAPLESLEYSNKAGALLPRSEEPMVHRRAVAKFTFWVHTGAAVFMMLVFSGMAAARDDRPYWPFLAAGVAAVLYALITRSIVRERWARTDITFYHGAIFPLAVAAILATNWTRNFDHWVEDLVRGVLIVGVIFADVSIVRALQSRYLRPPPPPSIDGDPTYTLDQIETLLSHDWEQISPHYLKLGPLSSFASVARAAQLDGADRFEGTAMVGNEIPDDAVDEARSAPRGGGRAGGGPGASRMPATGRPVSAGARQARAAANALVIPARATLTLVDEYMKATRSKQSASVLKQMAERIADKGEELSSKFETFSAACQAEPPLAGAPDRPEFRVIHAVADSARGFAINPDRSVLELAGRIPEAQAAIEGIKGGLI